MDNINMKDNKYITVLDFEIGRIFQYKTSHYFNSDEYEQVIIDNGHSLSNCQWMIHDIKEIVDHTIRSVIKKDK